MLVLMLIGLNLSTYAQEEPAAPTEETVTPESSTEASAPTETPEKQPEITEQEQATTEETAPEEIATEKPAQEEPAEQIITETEAIVIPDVPEPIIEDATTIVEELTPQSPVGIDTVSLEEPQGNWLFKRIWWERAEERYEKIRLLVDAIWESRTRFFLGRNKLDREILDPFYIGTGLTLGELQIILSEQIDLLEKQREEEGTLTEEERETYESLATEQESLKQLKMDIDSIANLDHAIDDALDKLMQQINNARNLETQAWNNFKEIAHILNDTKARELYYMIEGAARNIKNISNYLEQSFLTHFDTLMYETVSHIQRVQARMQALKEKGVTFKSQAEQKALQEEQERLRAEEEATEQEEEEAKPKPKTGLFNWIISGIKSVFSFIVSIIRLPYDMIFGGK